MHTRKVVLIVACISIVAALVWIRTESNAGAGGLTLAIVDRGINKSGDHIVLLQITNRGPYRICYPDSFSVQTRDTPREAYLATTNLWLDPGEGANVSVSLFPSITSDWRGVVSYIVESPWNRFKMRVGASSIGKRLPPSLTAVQGTVVRSPWIHK